MKRIRTTRKTSILVIGSLTILASLCFAGSVPAHVKNQPGKGWVSAKAAAATRLPQDEKPQHQQGWLEGRVRLIDGSAATDWTHVLIVDANKKGYEVACSQTQGGFYQFRDIEPGTYEVWVKPNPGYDYDFGKKTRPKRLFGVLVRAGVRSVLNATMLEGETTDIEEIGNPVVPTTKALIISQELERLQKEIDALKK